MVTKIKFCLRCAGILRKLIQLAAASSRLILLLSGTMSVYPHVLHGGWCDDGESSDHPKSFQKFSWIIHLIT